VVAHRLHRCPHVDVPEPDRAVAGAHRSSYAMMMEAYKNGATDPTFLYSAPGWADVSGLTCSSYFCPCQCGVLAMSISYYPLRLFWVLG
jgi:hypothetical protein